MDLKGQSRVIIENVQPQVDGGLYPAKRTAGETVTVTADIFGDGHDHIRAHLLFKKAGEKKWEIKEFSHLGNDVWAASFKVLEKGTYLFTVQAWVDHLETWYDGFKKKADARVDVHVELMEGALLLKQLPNQTKEVKAFITQFGQKDKYAQSIEAVLSREFADLVHANPLVSFETKYHTELKVQVEHAKANFSTWYELFPRSASLDGSHGTFKDVIKLLPRIQSMGFDVLYLPPIHPIGKVNRKGKNNNVRSMPGEPGSPWAIGSDEGGHKAIHPQLGTLDDYKQLIREAKEFGIEIAMDVAFQCAPDHPYVKEHPVGA